MDESQSLPAMNFQAGERDESEETTSGPSGRCPGRGEQAETPALSLGAENHDSPRLFPKDSHLLISHGISNVDLFSK